MSIIAKLCTEIESVLITLYGIEKPKVEIEQTNEKFDGDFTFVVFPYLRYSRKKPEDTASEIGHLITDQLDEIEQFNVVKGFLNLKLSNTFWIEKAAHLFESNLDIPSIGSGKTVVVEYSSPNTNKPLHLGHIRNNVLGFSISKILEANGFKVIKNNLINDRGIHICKSMVAWQKFGEGETPENSGIKGDHLVGKYYVEFDKAYKVEVKGLVNNGLSEEDAKEEAPLMKETRAMLKDWEDGNQKVLDLWKEMNGWVYVGFDKTYGRLGVSFDKIYHESETYLLGKKIVNQGLETGAFYKKEDGSVWIDLTDEGLDHKILQRADGTSVYITQDIGTAILKYQDFKMDKSIYVVGNEQDYHFKVLALILKRLDEPHADAVYHMSYGMVDLPEGKMKSREGTVVDADDLMEEVVSEAKKQTEELGKTEGMNEDELNTLYETIGIGALKYFLLRVDAKKRMLFDPNESIQLSGDTGPFVQYAYTRTSSIIEATDKVEDAEVETLNTEEKELIKQLSDYGKVVNKCAQDYNPSILSSYCYDLAKSYNKFYHNHSILAAEDENTINFRVLLTKQTGETLKHGFSLLGISMPERM